jgi:hypothetical protein
MTGPGVQTLLYDYCHFYNAFIPNSLYLTLTDGDTLRHNTIVLNQKLWAQFEMFEFLFGLWPSCGRDCSSTADYVV